MTPLRKLRDLPGVLLRDIPRYRRALNYSGADRRSDPQGWISLRNRIEAVSPALDGPGMVCQWTWGSPLHAAQVLPSLSRHLLGASLAEWPIRFANQPRVISDTPKISFVFAHAGMHRLPQLQRTLRSIFAQLDVPCECIVIDQTEPSLLGEMPTPVVYRHLAKDGVPPGWHKAWAYNIGARLARGSILVFQDGDVCAPEGYAREIVRAIEQRGYAAASLQRLLFYLSKSDTQALEASNVIESGFTPVMAFQNWKGGTIAIRKDAFSSIGGFDEGFVDWGGEDDEFYNRCSALGHCRGGYLPFIHLWHPPQPDRKDSTNPNIADVLPWRLAISQPDRIRELNQRRWGQADAPDPLTGYKAQRKPA
jgi:hypothetical protein